MHTEPGVGRAPAATRRHRPAVAAAPDAAVARYLPGVVPGDLGRRVTVRMLLNHTSGLGDYDDVLLNPNDPESAERLRVRTLTPQELISIGLSQPPTNAPGERWSYSHTNYIVLG